MVELKDVFIPEVAKPKDEFIEWVVGYKELQGTLEYDREYNDLIGMAEEYPTKVYVLKVEGRHYILVVEFWDGSMFIIGEDDYQYDEDGNVLMDGMGYPYGTLYTKSVVAKLYNPTGELLADEEYFEHGLGNALVTYHVIDDEEHLVYMGHMGYTVPRHYIIN